jgi:hypothetical protein
MLIMSSQFTTVVANNQEIFEYFSLDDHANLAVAFMDRYIHLLLDQVSYPNNTKFDEIVKHVLVKVKINRLKSVTLERLHRGFWNHISEHCKLGEKFVYKWSHKICMFRLRVNSNCRNTVYDDEYNGTLAPRQFSEKFISVFPGMADYKPCYMCFEDTDHDHIRHASGSEWVCDYCVYLDDPWYGCEDPWLEVDYHYPSDEQLACCRETFEE